jgi:3-isopropylmalate/(R)-2-methylmalate dehydratase large subunit
MSIECGARGGMIAPDKTTISYIKGRRFAPKGEAWDRAVAYWQSLKSDEGAVFDTEYHFTAADIEPMITYGTNPGMGIGISKTIPTGSDLEGTDKATFLKSLKYMDFNPGLCFSG